MSWIDSLSTLLLAAAALLALARALAGPSAFDRLVAAETAALVLVGYLLLQAKGAQTRLFLDSAFVLALVSFVATVFCAVYLGRRELDDD